MRTLKSILALAAMAMIAVQVETEHKAATASINQQLPLSFESGPARILARACGNCHSDHTEWPWYSHVPPVSGWIAEHVREGREMLDFSEWESYSASEKRDKLQSVCGLITTGRMPPWPYAAVHPEAKLTEKDKQAVCDWVKEQTIATR